MNEDKSTTFGDIFDPKDPKHFKSLGAMLESGIDKEGQHFFMDIGEFGSRTLYPFTGGECLVKMVRKLEPSVNRYTVGTIWVNFSNELLRLTKKLSDESLDTNLSVRHYHTIIDDIDRITSIMERLDGAIGDTIDKLYVNGDY